MRLITFIIGMISVMAFSAGWVFQILHLPGATDLSLYGFLGIAFLFLPMLVFGVIRKYSQKALADRLKIGLGFVSVFLVGLSVVFKILHLQGAPQLLVVGAVLFILGFLPVYFFLLYKSNS